MNARAELGREAEAILYAGGFRNAAAKHHGPFWTLYGVFAGNEHSGATHKQANPQDPRELARVLVARVQAEPDVIADEPEAPETVEETFAPGEGPFDPQPEPEQIPAHETHGETGEVAAQDDEVYAAVEPYNSGPVFDADTSSGHGESDDDEQPGRDDPGAVLDADYTLPEIELIPPELDPDFGAELLEFVGELAAEPEPEAAGAFIFGDNLDQKRTAAIGLVVQAAIVRMPAITPADDARLAELRNFTLGVSEGRWANDPSKQAELEALELIASLARQVEAARDAKVAFLVAATREQIEAFDPESDWP
jgi:hypothetical protein